jgi:hypothetical protein
MKKIAIFVEGQTELVFVKKFLEELAGKKNIKLVEASRNSSKFVTLAATSAAGARKYFALIVDCRGDHSVKSAILERRGKLLAAGYDIIVGLRDLYPLPRSGLAKLERGLRHGLPTANCPTHICVAVMEVEAWFAQEESHYARIDQSLSEELIRQKLGVDITKFGAEDIQKPSEFLDLAYQLVGKRYKKKMSSVSRTVNAIDYANLFYCLRPKLPHFAKFAAHVDEFLS